jgi:hypothetical protein
VQSKPQKLTLIQSRGFTGTNKARLKKTIQPAKTAGFFCGILRAEILAPIRRLAGGRIFFAQNPSGGDRSKAIRRKSKVIRRGSGQKIFVCVPAVKTCPAVGGQRAAIEVNLRRSAKILRSVIDLVDLSSDHPQHAQRESQIFRPDRGVFVCYSQCFAVYFLQTESIRNPNTHTNK